MAGILDFIGNNVFGAAKRLGAEQEYIQRKRAAELGDIDQASNAKQSLFQAIQEILGGQKTGSAAIPQGSVSMGPGSNQSYDERTGAVSDMPAPQPGLRGMSQRDAMARIAPIMAQLSPEKGAGMALDAMAPPEAPAPIKLGANESLYDPTNFGQIASNREPEKANYNQPFLPDGTPNQAYQEYQQRVRAAGRPNTNVTVTGGGDGPQFGTVPPGHVLRKTPDGGYVMEPVAGSPAARELADAEAKKKALEKNTESKSIMAITDIDRALKIMDTSNTPVVGILGTAAEKIPNTPAHNLGQILVGVKARIGFDELNKMRQTSPTGAALGAVQVQELVYLQSLYGSLAQSQNDEQLRFNLQRLKKAYQEVIDGTSPASKGGQQAGGGRVIDFGDLP